MSVLARIIDKNAFKNLPKATIAFCSTKPDVADDEMEFRVLNLRPGKLQQNQAKRKQFKPNVYPPRTNQMSVTQDWGSIWPGPRTFHPASVPLPIRQGYTEKGRAPPEKYANAELMKIPNFLHLTPPVIKRQCEALKKFCTPFPKELTEENMHEHFPFEVITSSYCNASPTIRDHKARIVTIRFQLKSLGFDKHAKDKFLRLIGDRYDEKTDLVTIVTDRCPLRQQNYDYAMYLITALYHESLNVEPWEKLKSEADMEVYIWENNQSRKSIESLFDKPAGEIEGSKEYSEAVTRYMNEGENDYTIKKYAESVRKLLNIPTSPNVTN